MIAWETSSVLKWGWWLNQPWRYFYPAMRSSFYIIPVDFYKYWSHIWAEDLACLTPLLCPHHPLCACPQRVQRKEGNEDDRSRDPLHFPNLHQPLLQLWIWHLDRHNTEECKITTACQGKITFNSQYFRIGLQELPQKKVFFSHICKRYSASTYSSARPCFSWESTNALQC